jgi:hypothetical protein
MLEEGLPYDGARNISAWWWLCMAGMDVHIPYRDYQGDRTHHRHQWRHRFAPSNDVHAHQNNYVLYHKKL